VSQSTTTERRDWNWERDGVLDGHYVETRQVTVKNGPAAGKQKLVFDFHVGTSDEPVSVWETAVIRSKFQQELRRRGKPDFEAGEQITITPNGTKTGAHGDYRDFEIDFEHEAPKRTAAELLGDPGPENDSADPGPEVDTAADADSDIPF
jgi:hypothetical protein